MPIDPRDVANHAAKVSALRHSLHLVGAHAPDCPEKTACTTWLSTLLEELSGGGVRRCRCGGPVVLTAVQLQAHDDVSRLVRCRSCKNNLRGTRYR
jgi:hypothetical protein